jgi:hypothetical protein
VKALLSGQLPIVYGLWKSIQEFVTGDSFKMPQEVEFAIQLLRVHDRTPVAGWLRSIRANHLDDFERLWKPVPTESMEADQYWDWEQKSQLTAIVWGQSSMPLNVKT